MGSLRYGDITDATCDAVDAGRAHWGPRARLAIAEVLTEFGSTFKLSQPLATLTVTPGVGDYSLATGLGVSDARMVVDVFYQPVGQQQASPPLLRTSPARIDEIRSRSVTQTYPKQYAVAGVDQLMLAPSPSDAGTLSVRYVQDIGFLAADSDVPALLPVEFHDLIWLGAARKIAPMKRPPVSPAVLNMLNTQYAARLGDLRSWLIDVAGSRPLTMSRPGTVIPSNDPSIYPAYSRY